MTGLASFVRLLPAGAEHRDFVASLSARVFARFGAYDIRLPEMMGAPGVRTTIAGVRGAAVGFVMFSLAGDARGEVDLVAIAVRPEWQSRGVGTRLLEHVENEARRRVTESPATVRLSVAVDNRTALRLFRRAGYARLPGVGGRYPGGQRSIGLFKNVR
jgi:ribosomal protein S18 acetylase RimI-like enzyme